MNIFNRFQQVSDLPGTWPGLASWQPCIFSAMWQKPGSSLYSSNNEETKYPGIKQALSDRMYNLSLACRTFLSFIYSFRQVIPKRLTTDYSLPNNWGPFTVVSAVEKKWFYSYYLRDNQEIWWGRENMEKP